MSTRESGGLTRPRASGPGRPSRPAALRPTAWRLVAVLLALLPTLSRAQGTDAAQRPSYQVMRQDEDWSVLCNPGLRTDYADPLKHVPLGGGAHAWLGGESRSLYEYYGSALFNAPEAAGDGYLLQRFMGHAGVAADLLPGRLGVRTFVEVKSGLVAGKQAGPAPPDEDRLDLNQAFVEATLALRRSPPGAPPSPAALLRLGRQELHYGAGRLVSVREGPNVRRAFDGVLVRLRTGAVTADAFYTVPEATRPGVFDNGRVDGERFWGGHASGPLVGPHRLDVYYFGTDLDRTVPYDQGPATETRHTVGARWSVQSGLLAHDVEVVGQFGSFRPVRPESPVAGSPGTAADGRIRAWTVSTSTSLALAALPLAPRLGLYTGFASGDGDPADDRLGTFRAPYPPGRFFGFGNALGPQNVAGLRPSVAVSPVAGLTAEAGVYGFWRASVRDGLYSPPGIPVRTGRPSRARAVAVLPEVAITWRPDRHTLVGVEASYVLTSRYLDETGPAPNTLFVATRAVYQF